jgi:uncharacterized OsmC-like protein
MTTKMQTKLITAVNGVDLTRLTDTIEAAKAAPEVGRFKFRIQNRWINGGQNRSKVQQFSAGGRETQHRTDLTMEADEPEVLLGTDNGANPVEHLLHALASCVTTSMIYHAAARGIAVEQVESSLEGDLDLRGFLGLAPNVRKGYQQIRLKLSIKLCNWRRISPFTATLPTSPTEHPCTNFFAAHPQTSSPWNTGVMATARENRAKLASTVMPTGLTNTS